MKWVGGKKKMLPVILPHYTGQDTVIEPFFGGGALSFHLSASNPNLHVVANDKLGAVIDIYDAVRTDVEAFITGVDAYANPYLQCPDSAARRVNYYKVRQQYMEQTIDGPEPLFFLLWCAYSGLFRTGKEFPGRFNTSHGFGKEKAGFYHPERLRGTAPTMGNWTLTNTDFSDTLQHVTPDTFLFLDPPYRGTYTGYTDDGFTETDQIQVAKLFKDADAIGAKVVYTNKDLGDDFYKNHFAGYTIGTQAIKYSVNRNAATVGRPTTNEVVIHN